MSDKAVEVISEALMEQGAAYPNAGAILVVDALKVAGIALVDGLTEEWGVFTERNSRGEIVNAQLHAADRDHAEELAQRAVAQFWRRHGGVAGAGIVKPEPEVRTRLVGPWREVSE